MAPVQVRQLSHALLLNVLSAGKEVTFISQDNYYKDHTHLTLDERALINYDHPFAFDNELLIEHLGELKQGQTAYAPVYDFTMHARFTDQKLELLPNNIVIIEGLHVLSDEKLREQLDIKVFVDTDPDVRICAVCCAILKSVDAAFSRFTSST